MRRVLLVALAGVLALLAACSSEDHPQAGAKPAEKGTACPSAGASASGRSVLPDLTLPCLGRDQQVSMRTLTGVPTVLNLWATWCVECRQELPAMQRFATAAGAKVRVLGVDTLDPKQENALSYLADAKVRFPSVYDSGRKLLTALGVPGMPVSVFVRSDGSIAKVHPAPMTFQQLRKAAAEYLHVDVAA